MAALTINDMLELFGIKANRELDTGAWICVLPDGRMVVTSQDKMERLAKAFAEWLFDDNVEPPRLTE